MKFKGPEAMVGVGMTVMVGVLVGIEVGLILLDGVAVGVIVVLADEVATGVIVGTVVMVGIWVGIEVGVRVGVVRITVSAELFILKMKKIPKPDKISKTMDGIRNFIFFGSIYL